MESNSTETTPSATAAPLSGEALFLANLERIGRIVGALCRRNGLFGADAEEFRAQVHLKLIDKDYAVLRKFQGKSRLSTYLTTVIANLFRDERIKQWGKWRPSAQAKRLGKEALLLERLVHCHGHSDHEALEILHRNHRVETPRKDLEAMLIQLPTRSSRRIHDPEAVDSLESADGPEKRLGNREDTSRWLSAEAALKAALQSLSKNDALLIKMRFSSGLKISRIAQVTGQPQRQLYRRFEKILVHLRKDLENRGLKANDLPFHLEAP
jgi:RNA polymerase sigma factor for flagellar operon FliA